MMGPDSFAIRSLIALESVNVLLSSARIGAVKSVQNRGNNSHLRPWYFLLLLFIGGLLYFRRRFSVHLSSATAKIITRPITVVCQKGEMPRRMRPFRSTPMIRRRRPVQRRGPYPPKRTPHPRMRPGNNL